MPIDELSECGGEFKSDKPLFYMIVTMRQTCKLKTISTKKTTTKHIASLDLFIDPFSFFSLYF